MEFKIIKESAVQSDVAVVGVFEKEKVMENFSCLFQPLHDLGDFNGAFETHAFLYPEHLKFQRVLFVGLGEKKEFNLSQLKNILKKVAHLIQKTKSKNAALFLESFENESLSKESIFKNTILFLEDAFYTFSFYKKDKKDKKENFEIFLALTAENKHFKEILKEAQAISEGIRLTKDLGNQPANICTPDFLVETAKSLVKKNKNIHIEILNKNDLKKEGLNALLSVAQGSAQNPYLIHLEYGKEHGDSVVFIGKGVCFDSGGISLKPALGMEEMKFDMCGAASVLGAFLAAVETALPIHLHVLIPAVENMPGGTATRPGDVVRSLSGQTIEIINTDAEGRLILCDSLTFAERFHPKAVVDVATLTGACVIALGHVLSGLFSNNPDLEEQLFKAGQKSGDLLWRMPLMEEYQKLLESSVADMTNSGGREAGSISAACFLSRFTQNYPWAHLDIAGTAWITGKKKAATGRPVVALYQFLKDFKEIK